MQTSKRRIPTWDGNPKQWRRYVKEVAWHVQGTKPSERPYLASQFRSELTGSARLLAMSWPDRDFEGPDSVLQFLRRLAKSPLARRPLPNANATFNQYFNFRRFPGESVSSFLVREILAYEEFLEAILMLKDHKYSVDTEKNNFGMSPTLFMGKENVTERRWQHWGNHWYQWRYQPTEEEEAEPAPQPNGVDVPVPSASDEVGSAGVEADDPGASSPAQVSVEAKPIQEVKDIKEMNELDSFILDTLRGWRLVAAANLHPDEKRDVLTATQTKMEYQIVADALVTLYDEDSHLGKKSWHGNVNHLAVGRGQLHRGR